MAARGSSYADHSTATFHRVLTDRDNPSWGIGAAAFAFVCGLLGSTLSVGVWSAASGDSGETLGILVVGLAGLWLGYLGVIAIALRRPVADTAKRETFREQLGLRVAGLNDVIVGFGSGLASSVLLVPIVYFVLLSTGVLDDDALDKLSEPAERVTQLGQGAGSIVVFVLVGIGAPIAEEIFFRGFLQRALVARVGPWAGVITTALVFGAAHFEPLQFPALAAFGLVLGVLAYRSDRLGPSIFAHIAFNALTLTRLAGG